MFGNNKANENSEDYKNFLTESKKSGFQKFIEGQKDYDKKETLLNFLDEYFFLTPEKIISDIESEYYSKDTVAYITEYYHNDKTLTSEKYRFYNSVLDFRDGMHLFEIDKEYPLYVYICRLTKDEDEKNGEYTIVNVGARFVAGDYKKTAKNFSFWQ